LEINKEDVVKMVLKMVSSDEPQPEQLGYLYETVADEIEEVIKSGELPLKAPLPNERRMAENLGVSLGTARRAVEVLRDRGLVVTLRSKGTFVVSQERRPPMTPDQARLV
jgi:DNA-binding GntR family transcriptional regulator